MIWLMLRGELPHRAQARLLEAALVAAVDHGPQAPSIAIARMAATCGVGLNGAMASALNMLDDVHGGAGRAGCRAVPGHRSPCERRRRPWSLRSAARHSTLSSRTTASSFPASAIASIRSIRARRACSPWSTPRQRERRGRTVASRDIARAVEAALQARKGKLIPLNIDGATAVIYAELGFAAALARGLFCLSRSVGILAHAWEQTQPRRAQQGADAAAVSVSLFRSAPP